MIHALDCLLLNFLSIESAIIRFIDMIKFKIALAFFAAKSDSMCVQ